MRIAIVAAIAAACGKPGTEPVKAGSATSPATGALGSPDARPLVMLHAANATLAGVARAALDKAGMRVADGKPLEDALNGPLFFGFINTPPPAEAPPQVAAQWTNGAQRCTPAHDKCPRLSSAPECEDLMRCTHTLIMSLREAWIRESGAVAWVTVVAGASEKTEGLTADGTGFYAKAWGHKPCELSVRSLRVGAESGIMTVGSDAPLPNSVNEANALAGDLAVRIVRGEGSASDREPLVWVKPPTNDSEWATLLGCSAVAASSAAPAAVADAGVGDASGADAPPQVAIPAELQNAPAWIGRSFSVSDKAQEHWLLTTTLHRAGEQAVFELDSRTRRNDTRGDTRPFPQGERKVMLGTIVEKGRVLTFTGTAGDKVVCKRKQLLVAGATAGLARKIGGEECNAGAKWVPAKMKRIDVLSCEGDVTAELAAAPGVESLDVTDDCGIRGGGYRLIGADGALAEPRAK